MNETVLLLYCQWLLLMALLVTRDKGKPRALSVSIARAAAVGLQLGLAFNIISRLLP